MINGALVVMRWQPEIMMAQALRLPDLRPISVRMAMINIAIQEDLADALALVARSVKALLLDQPNQWVRRSDTEDPKTVHWSPTNSCEVLVSLSW